MASCVRGGIASVEPGRPGVAGDLLFRHRPIGLGTAGIAKLPSGSPDRLALDPGSGNSTQCAGPRWLSNSVASPRLFASEAKGLGRSWQVERRL